MEETSLVDSLAATSAASDSNFGWQKVTYPKRHRKQAAVDPSTSGNQPAKNTSGNVFATVEQKANERHRAIQSMNAALLQPPAVPRGAGSDEDEYDEDAPRVQENGGEASAKKPKKPKKPKVTLAEAAAGIDVNDLAAYIADISVWDLV
jgi:hypothetical protein